MDTLENPLGNALHQSQTPLHHPCGHIPSHTCPPTVLTHPGSTYTQSPQQPAPFGWCTLLPTTHPFIDLVDSHAHARASIMDLYHHLQPNHTTTQPTSLASQYWSCVLSTSLQCLSGLCLLIHWLLL